MTLPKLIVSCVTFDVTALAKALRITPEQVVQAFRDGRGAWPFSEMWGEQLYEFIKHANSNQPFSDGAVALTQLRDVNVSVKALTKAGVKFQQSKFVGVNRSATKADLVKSVEACDRVIVVDIVEFPEVRFIPVDGTRLVGAVHIGRLTTNGWSRPQFQKWLSETYLISEISLKI